MTNKFDNYYKSLIKEIFENNERISIFSNKQCLPFTNSPTDLVLKDCLFSKSSISSAIDNLFTVFCSFNGNCYLATLVKDKNNIEIYDLKTDSLVCSLIGHTSRPYIVRHFPNYLTATDYLLSTSASRDCRIWNVNTFQNVLTIKNCHSGLYLYSALIIFDNYDNIHKNIIVTSCPNEYMKIYNMDTGSFIRDIGSKDYTYFINSWNNKKNNQYYIINANSESVKIYGIGGTNDIYGRYFENPKSWHMSAFVETLNDVEYLFESDGLGNVRLWNIESKIIYKKINYNKCNFRGLCLWNKEYLAVASSSKTIVVINFIEEKVAKTIDGEHKNTVCTVTKLRHPKYGECLFSGSVDGTIKLYVDKNYSEEK